MLRSLGILLIALSLVGPSSLLRLARECSRCAEHCPMKKPRLPCQSATGSAISSCSHQHASAAPLVRDLALLIPRSFAISSEAATRFTALTALSPDTPLLEPPTDPPRFSSAA